jgi:hypothetical protein
MELRSVSRLFKKYLKLPDGDLCMLTMPIVERGKYNLITQGSKSFSLQKLHINSRELKGFLNKYADPTISVYFLTKI